MRVSRLRLPRRFISRGGKSRSTAISLRKRMLEKKGSISMVSSLTFMKKVIKSNKRKFKRKKKNDNSSHLSPCETVSIDTNDSQENELVTPISSPTRSNVIEECPEDDDLDGTETTTNQATNVEGSYEGNRSEDAELSEDHSSQHEETSTSIKELIFDDNTAVIFHFDEANRWTIEIIENAELIIPTTMKKKDPIAPIMKSVLPDHDDIEHGKKCAKMAISKDIKRLKKGAKNVLEFMITIDSALHFTSTITNEKISRGFARMKTIYWYIRIIR